MTLGRWLRGAVRCFAALGALLQLLMWTPAADWSIRPLVVPLNAAKTDAIVLLTAWASPDGLLNVSGVQRTLQAARLYRQGVANHVVVSGRNRSNDAGPTARLMSTLLMELGVPQQALVLETESTNTHESAVKLAELAHARDWSTLTIVSDGKHMRRALGAFRHEGLNVRSGSDPRIDLRSSSGPERLGQLQAAIHEWGGLLYYWWREWI